LIQKESFMSSPYLDPKFKELEKEYNAVVQCNRCGFCETVCPTYMVSGKETLSPRGRNQAFRELLEGKIKNPENASEIFSTCLTCHACTNVCFSEVPVAKLMSSARACAQDKNNFYPLQQFLLSLFLSQRKLFSLICWFLFLCKRLGISKILKQLKLLRFIPELEAGEDIILKTPLIFGGKKNVLKQRKQEPSLSKKMKNAYFSGCGIHYLYPKVSTACLKVLNLSNLGIESPNHSCCGLIAASAGNLKIAKELAKKNIKEFSRLNPNQIIVDDDSCCGFMKSYGELLNQDPQAVQFSNKIKNISEFILENEAIPQIGQTKTMGKVTYHDPCQMGNAHKSTDAPRKILQNLKGLAFVEMDESNWCCGGAGSYCLKHPSLAEDILERKLLNIEKTGAEIVITQASSCLLHLEYGIRKKGWQNKLKIMHLAELLSDSILQRL